MITWVPLYTAVAIVDLAVIVLSKFFPLTKALGTWYREFGVVAVAQDILIIMLGIALVKFLFPAATGWLLAGLAIGIQILHDVLFYVGVIQQVPWGQNKIIDLFKAYAAEGSWKIIVADSAMIGSSALLMEALDNNLSDDQIGFIGMLVTYALSYIIYTK